LEDAAGYGGKLEAAKATSLPSPDDSALRFSLTAAPSPTLPPPHLAGSGGHGGTVQRGGRRNPAELHGRERRGDGSEEARVGGVWGRQALGEETARRSLEVEAGVAGPSIRAPGRWAGVGEWGDVRLR
jgi:hypothetical protein